MARPSLHNMRVLSRERLGEVGSVNTDGNECRIGTVDPSSGDFTILGRGPSWEAAWDDLYATSRSRAARPEGDSP